MDVRVVFLISMQWLEWYEKYAQALSKQNASYEKSFS